MSAGQTKQPVAVVAESLMRTCYDEANRLANHGSNGLERMVMSHLYDAANEAKARLAAAAADVVDAPPEAKTAFASSAWLAEWEAALRMVIKAGENTPLRHLNADGWDRAVRACGDLERIVELVRGHSQIA